MRIAKLFTALTLAAGAAFGQMTIVNGASYNPNQPIAPGSFATIFGQNLCGQTASGTWVAAGQLPTTLGNCSVSVNGTAAMLHYVSPGQINFIVPPSVAPGPAGVAVNDGSQVINGTMTVAKAGPGTFALNGMGVGEGAMLNGMNWKLGPFSTDTNGRQTAIALYVTGLDLSTIPTVSVGGMPAQVLWFGNAPGYAGLQQINVSLPPGAAGAGRVPVTVTSDGQTSNVTFMHVLPTSDMMHGMPGWSNGVGIVENAARGHELSYVAFGPNNSALVTDENDDVVRVISLDSGSTTATITLPEDSAAHAITVNATGTLAAVALSAKASVAIIDLSKNQVVSVIGVGNYPSHLAFAGTNLLVTNQAGRSVSVVDTTSGTVTQTVTVGVGPSGIAVAGNLALVANLQDGTLSKIDLTTGAVSTITLPAGSRPYEIAISTAANVPAKALITTPNLNSFLILDLTSGAVTSVDTGTWNAMGPGAVVISGTTAYIANMMTASITMVDVAAGKVVKTFSVDPGPRALALAANSQLLVLCEGTGTLDVVDLGSDSVKTRLDAGETERQGNWPLPWISSLTPSTAAAGSTITLTINGTNLDGVTGLEFNLIGSQQGGPGRGMMNGGGMGQGMGTEDSNIKVSNVHVNSTGTQITASVQILEAATAGVRQVRLETDRGEVMGPMFNSFFTVTK